jgi:hypothetical protein
MEKGNSANSKLDDTLQVVDSTSLTAYPENTVIKGKAVINAIRNIESIGGNIKLGVTVRTLANATVDSTGKVTNEASSKVNIYGYATGVNGTDGNLTDNASGGIGGGYILANVDTTDVDTLYPSKLVKSTSNMQYKVIDPSVANYINPAANFRIYTYITQSNVVDGLAFVQE